MKFIKSQDIESSTVKKEITNGCFFKKKEISNQLNFFKNSNKTNLFMNQIFLKDNSFYWDEERQLLFSSDKNNKIENLGICFKANVFFHFEEFFFGNFSGFQFKKIKLDRIFKKLFWGKIKIKKVFFYFSIFLFLKKSGFYVLRFRLFDRHSVRPNFFCWNKNKILKTIFCLLIYSKPFSPGFTGSFSSLLTKLKPTTLKIAVISKSVIMFFSVDNGFASTCPLFCNKLRIKKKGYFKKKLFLFRSIK
mmetsp:Transcript_48076/g.120180  ORF Transcript_48076/g.120180 Transcript_48076/m.120180 type:complete len:248 (-) Transcript_48076:41-784(-)